MPFCKHSVMIFMLCGNFLFIILFYMQILAYYPCEHSRVVLSVALQMDLFLALQFHLLLLHNRFVKIEYVFDAFILFML